MKKPPQKRSSENGGNHKKSHRAAGMVIGFLMAVAGTVLFLLNYSTNPAPTYIGMAIGPLGLIIMLVSALMRDKLNPKTPNGNGQRRTA